MRLVAAVVLGVALICTAPAHARSPCTVAFAGDALCPPVGEEARRLFTARGVMGAVVIEDVASGAIVGFGAHRAADEKADMPPLTVAAPILPLSVAKLFLVASIWEHEADLGTSPEVLEADVGRIMINSDDKLGREWATILRQRVGTEVVLTDLARYGVPACERDLASEKDHSFWGTPVASELAPSRPCALLDDRTSEQTWADAFSLGEAKFSLSLLHLVRFVQCIANNGVMTVPSLTTTPGERREPNGHRRVMPADVAARLRADMFATVERGTASNVKARLKGGWRLAGKTGSAGIHGKPYDGIFVGFIADPTGKARYAFAIYVRRGGFGGGAAAEIVCDLFNYALGL